MEKNQIRKKYTQLRNLLSETDFETHSEKITNKAIALLQDIKPNCIHCFLPIESKLELNTYPIIEYCLENGIKVVIPVSDFTTNTMKSAHFTKTTTLSINKYGIPEPETPIWTNDNEIDIVFTPLLAFDEKGYRVGYGKGFYDTFFSILNNKVHKIGLSAFEACDTIQDIYPHDIQLNKCITPLKTYSF